MKSLKAISKIFPEGTLVRTIVDAAVADMAENDEQLKLKRAEFERKRQQRRDEWDKRHPSNS